MKDALRLDIRGIKCDNPDCDYREEGVLVSDYEKWLNKPCPKCGSNLLTQADYEATKALITVTKIINSVLPNAENDEKVRTVSVPVEMNGTGEIIIKV